MTKQSIRVITSTVQGKGKNTVIVSHVRAACRNKGGGGGVLELGNKPLYIVGKAVKRGSLRAIRLG